MFVRSDCSACQGSAPVFRKIAGRLSDTPTPMYLITSGARSDDEARFTQQVGIAADRLVMLNFSSLRLQVVPTLVVVDQQGTVIYASEGPPSDQQQEELLRAAIADARAS